MSPESRTSRLLNSIALLQPLGDFGITAHTHELAEAIHGEGLAVDVYCSGSRALHDLSGSYRLLPVLGSFLFRQRSTVFGGPPRPAVAAGGPWERPSRILGSLRGSAQLLELAFWLRRRRYDLVWTQWPDLGATFPDFWALCRRLGLKLVHTVHNVFPHERTPGDHDRYRRVYRGSHVLVVHSQDARRVLAEEFPECAHKIVVSALGLYSIYPRRAETRDATRASLGLNPDTPAALFFGGVRPYKNLDGILETMRTGAAPGLVLVVAGAESGYPDLDAGDRLARTRRLVREFGLEDRVRLVPGPFSIDRSSELFEACDVVLAPYTEGYGSGVLLLGMTFGKIVLATAVGGMDEYLAGYPAGICVDGSDTDSLADGLRQAAARWREGSPPAAAEAIREFGWDRIVQRTLPQILATLDARSSPSIASPTADRMIPEGKLTPER